MARIRTVKPDFFRHPELQDLEKEHPGSYTMMVFCGLWGHCDKGGVFEWKPRMLKLDILPFLEFDMLETLTMLESGGFLERYEAKGKTYGRIPSFEEHQRIGGKEAQEPVKHPRSIGEASGKQLGLQEGKGREKEGKGTDIALVPRETEWMLDFKLIYPSRSGDQGWRKAAKAANARLDEGHTVAELLDGARRYAAYIQATDAMGTVYVKQAATFLGPDKHFLEPWDLPRTKAEAKQDSNVAAGVEWLRNSA